MPNHHDYTQAVLGGTELFAGLSPGALERLAARATPRPYRKGHLIYHQDDPGGQVFVLADGSAKLTVRVRPDEEWTRTILRPPETFGELSLVDPKAPHGCSCEALEAAEVLVVSADRLQALPAADRKRLDTNLLARLARQLRHAQQQTADQAFLPLRLLVAKKLLELAQTTGSDTIQLSQAELARMVGGTRERINSILRSLQDDGAVRLDARAIKLLRPEFLRSEFLHRRGGAARRIRR